MYNRLFSKILDSSIWLESKETRIVWFTLLAAMDQNGYAHFSAIENLALRARVTVEEATEAVRILMSPDPQSANPAHEGRRIERVPGGFIVLNAAEHRKIASLEMMREQTKLRVQRWREKQGQQDIPLPPAPASPEQQQTQIQQETPRNAAVTHDEAEQLYKLYPRRQAKGVALKAIKKAGDIASISLLTERVKAFAEAVSRWPKEADEFIPLASTWFNQQRWEDDPKTWERTAPAVNVPPWRRREIIQSQVAELGPKVSAMPDGPERVEAHKRLTEMHAELKRIA